MGQSFEWDAEIINEEVGRFIAWQSLPGASVSQAESVSFEPATAGASPVKVAFGVAVGELLGSSPEADLMEDLQHFKAFAEKELVTAPEPTR